MAAPRNGHRACHGKTLKQDKEESNSKNTKDGASRQIVLFLALFSPFFFSLFLGRSGCTAAAERQTVTCAGTGGCLVLHLVLYFAIS
jgi:hypothetical protein